MAMKTKIMTAILAGCLLSGSAFAGDYATALGKCLYDNTNASDKTTLTQWAFVSLGKTSAAKSVVTIPAAKTNAVDQQAQNWSPRLVTTILPQRSCTGSLARIHQRFTRCRRGAQLPNDRRPDKIPDEKHFFQLPAVP